MARNLWHGNGENRFFDKSLQFVVTENGKAGMIGEVGAPASRAAGERSTAHRAAHGHGWHAHAALRGLDANQVPVARNLAGCCVRLTCAGARSLFKNKIDHGDSCAPAAHLPSPSRITFDVAAAPLLAAVQSAAERFFQLATAHDLSCIEFKEYGRDAVKGFGFSPDAWCQVRRARARGGLALPVHPPSHWRGAADGHPAGLLPAVRPRGGDVRDGPHPTVRRRCAAACALGAMPGRLTLRAASFLHGRTATIRSCSIESTQWVKSMQDASVPVRVAPLGAALLRSRNPVRALRSGCHTARTAAGGGQAAHAHDGGGHERPGRGPPPAWCVCWTQYAHAAGLADSCRLGRRPAAVPAAWRGDARVLQGRGLHAQLLLGHQHQHAGQVCMLSPRALGGLPAAPPALTPLLRSPYFQNWGWGEVVPDGLGIAYMALPRSLVFNLSSMNMGTRRMREALCKALRDMRALCEEVSEKDPRAKL